MLPTDPKERKKFPIATGCLGYFPQALLLVSRVSYDGNEQHNPGQPLRWAREKSKDQPDAALRHLTEALAMPPGKERAYLLAQVVWRVSAECELTIEAAGGLAAMYPGEGGAK